MKRLATLVMLVILTATLMGCGGPYKNGTYQGVGKGRGGDIVVEVTIEKGNIGQINTISHSETEGITDPVFEELPAEIIEKQSTAEIDVISGATIAFDGYIEAVNQALEQAKK